MCARACSCSGGWGDERVRECTDGGAALDDYMPSGKALPLSHTRAGAGPCTDDALRACLDYICILFTIIFVKNEYIWWGFNYFRRFGSTL